MIWHALVFICVAALARTQYIGAMYPDPEKLNRLLDRILAIARIEAGRADGFAVYRATLSHFISSFDDEHIGVSFNTEWDA